VYVCGVKNTRRFLEWIRAKYGSKLMAQMKGEILMLVPETDDGVRGTFGALRSLCEGGSMRVPVVEKLRQAHA
jgi:hypothetical protein